MKHIKMSETRRLVLSTKVHANTYAPAWDTAAQKVRTRVWESVLLRVRFYVNRAV